MEDANHIQRLFTVALIACASIFLTVSLCLFSTKLLPPCALHPQSLEIANNTERLAAWDGAWYRSILVKGYRYDRRHMSNVAFFPGHPVIASVLCRVLPIRAEVSLTVVACCFFCASLVLIAQPMSLRDESSREQVDRALWLAATPFAFFFRVAYSESLFLFWMLLAAYLFNRRANPLFIALAVGAATGTRFVGIAGVIWTLLAIFRGGGNAHHKIAKTMLLVPLSLWGVGAFSVFLWLQSGDPLAFAKAQEHWDWEPNVSLTERLRSTLMLKPIWNCYIPIEGNVAYWGRFPPNEVPLFNMFFLNPIVFLFSGVTIFLGWRRGWLTSDQAVVSATIWIIPYVTQGSRTCMASQARYSLVVFGVYFVLARVTKDLNFPSKCVLFGGMFALQCVFTVLFANWYWIY